MNRINYFQQGGTASQQNTQQQIKTLVQAAMQGDQEATQTINQIMQNAKSGDEKSIQLAQMIQQVMQQMKKSAKWGSKLEYIKGLKFKKGGKACPACMSEGGKTEKKKVAYKDIDSKTYQNLPSDQKIDSDLHKDTYAKSYNKDGSYNTSHKPTVNDSTEIHKKHMSPELIRKYAGKKKCGGKTVKKRYFGGWL